jgi:hypothetical protein
MGTFVSKVRKVQECDPKKRGRLQRLLIDLVPSGSTKLNVASKKAYKEVHFSYTFKKHKNHMF